MCSDPVECNQLFSIYRAVLISTECWHQLGYSIDIIDTVMLLWLQSTLYSNPPTH